MSSQHSDWDLIQETLAGSQQAFEDLIAKHQDRIFRLLHRFTHNASETEDLAQDVFLKVYKRLHTFQFESAFYTWLYRIAVNTATDFVQRKRKNPVQGVEDVVAFETPSERRGDSPDSPAMQRELASVANTVLEKLPEKYRNILMLREYEGLSYDEIGKILGCAMGTVESRLFRAREKFREVLEQYFPEYSSDALGERES